MLSALPRVALQLWIVLFIVFFGAEVIHLEPGLRVITQVLYGVPLAAWALLRLRGPADRLDWAVLGLLGFYGVVSLLGRDRTESLGTLALATAYGVWFSLLRREQGMLGPVVIAIATGLSLSLAFNAYLAIQEKLEWYAAVGGAPLEGVITFPWETVNALPVLVLLTIPFLVRLEAGPIRTLLASVAAASALVIIPISNGRAGYAGLVMAAIVFAALHPATARVARRSSVRQLGLASLVAAGVAGLIAVVIGPRFVDALSTSGRLLIWEQALHMFGGSPLIGSGPGVYSWVRLEFPLPGASLLAVRLPHSVPLLTLAEGGVVMAVGLILALAVWAGAVAQNRRNWSGSERATIAALVGFVVASFVDDFSFLPAVTAGVLALAAWLVPASPTRTSPRWLMPTLLGVAALVSIPSVVNVDVARSLAQDARTAMVRDAYDTAATDFDAAAAAHPENGGYWLGLGMASAWAEDDARAIAAYERARSATPGDPRAYAALATLDLDTEPVELLAAAADRTLGDPQYALRLGAALASAGRAEDAAQAWARAVALRPELIRRVPYVFANVSLEELAAEAARRIRLNPGPAPDADLHKLWDLSLVTDELPDDADLAWRAVDAARNGDLTGAAQLADQAVADAPYNARAYQAAAAVAAFACDSPGEERALANERATGHGWKPLEPEPFARREFVFREASLGPSQPPNATGSLEIERWPWSLIDRPECRP